MQRYLVGGAVRDRLLGFPVYDRDWVVVGATIDAMLDAGFQPVGKDFPVFLHPQSKEEYALARTERKAGHGYKGFEYYASPEITLEQDLLRRDLTINAMAEASDGTLIDPYGGQQDLQARVLRHVSPAFAEDPLRVLRVARFAARYHHLGFRIAPETLALMRSISASGELAHLTRERVWREFERAITERDPFVCLQVLHQVEALPVLLPELLDCFEQGQAPMLAATLLRSRALNSPSSVAFACLASFANPERLESLCERLRVPREHRELATLVCNRARDCQTLPNADAEARLTLLEALDLQRRPQRLAPFLQACLALQRDFPLSDAGCYPPALMLDQLQQLLSTLSPRTLVEEGFKGKALGRELRRRQLALIEEAIAQSHQPQAPRDSAEKTASPARTPDSTS